MPSFLTCSWLKTASTVIEQPDRLAYLAPHPPPGSKDDLWARISELEHSFTSTTSIPRGIRQNHDWLPESWTPVQPTYLHLSVHPSFVGKYVDRDKACSSDGFRPKLST